MGAYTTKIKGYEFNDILKQTKQKHVTSSNCFGQWQYGFAYCIKKQKSDLIVDIWDNLLQSVKNRK